MTGEDRQVRLVVLFGEDISDIVKRECGRIGSESWSGTVMFGKHTAIGPERVWLLVFL